MGLALQRLIPYYTVMNLKIKYKSATKLMNDPQAEINNWRINVFQSNCQNVYVLVTKASYKSHNEQFFFRVLNYCC